MSIRPTRLVHCLSPFRSVKSKPAVSLLGLSRNLPTYSFHCPAGRFYNHKARSRDYSTTLKSGLSLHVFAVGIVVSIASLIFIQAYLGPSDTPAISSTEESVETTSEVPWIRIYPGMPTQIPPGRPGNLTKEQEIKLKELWEALMGVCGSWPGKVSLDIGDDASESRASTIDESGKKKKRFGGLLGRKKNQDDSDASGSESVTEDKHGQTKEFKQALASQTPEELRANLWSFTKHDDPDAMLLRFLRARKWNVHDALVMLISTIHWRGQVMHLDDDIMRNGEGGALEASTNGSGVDKALGQDFLQQMRMGKSFLHGNDREGRPLCFVRVKLHKQGEQSEASLERYTVYTIETARFMLRPPVDTAVIVFDMTDFSMANMDYSPVKFMIKVFEANYPECLGHVLVHKSPWIFQGVWSIIKGWLDPVVASKVHFTKNAHELEQYISPEHVPKGLGGQENWEYNYTEPTPGENNRMRDTAGRQAVEKERSQIVAQYEAATVQWAKGEGNAQELQQTRLNLAEGLRRNYWKLDPFVRARSLYDRTGVIQGGGVVDMYPAEGKSGQHRMVQEDID